jgi:hypothetical protein
MSQYFAAQCSLEQILILMLKEEFLAGFKIKELNMLLFLHLETSKQ